MSLLQAVVLLVLVLVFTASAIVRVRKVKAGVSADAEQTAMPAGRLSVFSVVVLALAVFVYQWLIAALPVWALFVWVPAAVVLVYCAWGAARVVSAIPWLRRDRKIADLVVAVCEFGLAGVVFAGALFIVVGNALV